MAYFLFFKGGEKMKIYLTWEQVFPKGAILAESRPWYEYNGNQRTEKLLGTNYILIRRPEYEKVSVKIPTPAPIITNDEIENADDVIYVEAEGFVGVYYKSDNDFKVSGKAEKLIIKAFW